MQQYKYALSTRLAHGGPLGLSFGSVNAPMFDSASFVQQDKADLDRNLEDLATSSFYSGITNPTVSILEEKIARIESAPAALAFNAGMAAIATSVMAVSRDGGHIIVSDKLFTVTRRLFTEDLPRFGIEVSTVDFLDLGAVRNAFRDNTRAIYFEEFTNPILAVLDMEQLIAMAHEHGALAIVDNTFISPALMRPLEYGADLVLHSATKYLSGHGRVRGGVVAGSEGLIAEIGLLREHLGAIMSPYNAIGIIDGLRTLELRVERASRTALGLAKLAEAHPVTEQVHYPGLESNPGHEIANRLTGGLFGGVFSISLRDSSKKGAVYDRFELIIRATSLGDTVSLVDMNTIPDIVRISTGIEDPDDLAQDLTRALDAAL